MTSYVALLRAVNLAGLNRVPMAELRRVAEGVGLGEARTLLQSGNLVFRTPTARTGSTQLEAKLRAATAREVGVDTDFFVRTAAEWAEIVEGNPFPREAKTDPGHLVVLVCSEAPDRKRIAALTAAISGPEIVRAAPRAGRHAYVVYPDGIGRSKLTMALVERTLGIRGTARNWNTVLKLMAMLREG